MEGKDSYFSDLSSAAQPNQENVYKMLNINTT